MKKLIYIFILSSGLFFSCNRQHNQQNIISVDSTVLADTMINSQIVRISNDSFQLSLLFYDVNGNRVLQSSDFALVYDTLLKKYMSTSEGTFDTILPLKDYLLVCGADTFFISSTLKGGSVMTENVKLPIYEVKGRIMEVDGTPIAHMPIHLHAKYKSKGRKRIKDSYENDVTFYTNESGYYRTYVSSSISDLTLRTCGFLIGKISRSELENYPTQNFLFEPIRIKNICGDTIPPYNYTLTIESENLLINMDNRKELFHVDSLLEKTSYVILKASCDGKVLTKKIAKRESLFRNPSFTICLHD